MTVTHSISAAEFAALAATRGTPGGVTLLRAGQFSKNAILLRAIMDMAQQHLPEAYASSGFSDGYDLLAAVQEKAPDVVAAVLTHPHAGSWACHCVRTLHGVAENSHIMVTNLLGQMNALALAAAVKADHDCEIMLPLHRAAVLVPTLGLASFSAEPVSVKVHATCADSGLRIRAGSQTVVPPADYRQDAPGWSGLRRVSAEAEGLRFSVDLDDLGPFRDGTYRPPAGRLSVAEYEHWQQLARQAWNLLVTLDPDRAETTASVASTLVPLQGGGNSTSRDAFGAVYFGPLDDGPELAEILVHECQHSKLNALLDLIPLYEPSDELYYSPARNDPRPIGGLLHGCYAFAGVADYWRNYRQLTSNRRRDFAHLQFTILLEQLRQPARVLHDAGPLTTAGRDFVSLLITQLDTWAEESVPVQQRRWGESIAVDHYLRWRLNNVRHAPDDVRQLADAWIRKKPAPPLEHEPTLGAATRAPAHTASVRQELRHLHALSPDDFEVLRTQQDSKTIEGTLGATDADFAYLDGDYAEAASCYVEQIACEPGNIEHWAGLVLATQELDNDGDMSPLLESPELVHAVYGVVLKATGSAPDPWALARWLADYRAAATAQASGISDRH